MCIHVYMYNICVYVCIYIRDLACLPLLLALAVALAAHRCCSLAAAKEGILAIMPEPKLLRRYGNIEVEIVRVDSCCSRIRV